MNAELYKSAVEAVLFALAEPISPDKVADALALDTKTVAALIKELKNEYDDGERGLVILQFDDRYQMATRPVFADFVTRALDNRRNVPLSQAALEVLSIVAYNQPVSRSFIDQIRGVDSSSSVASLLAKNLIAEAGRLDLPGRPVSFKTTDNFLRCFGLSSVGDLPPVYSDDIELSLEEPVEEEDGGLLGE